jgi:O-antigen ligase
MAVSYRQDVPPRRSYVQFILLCFISFSPWVFGSSLDQLFLVLALTVAGLSLSNRTWRVLLGQQKTILLPLVFLFSIVGVAIVNSFVSITSIGILVRLFIGAMLIADIGALLPKVAYRTVAAMSAISLVFFATQFVFDAYSFPGVSPPGAPHDNLRSVILHTYLITAPERNAGFTWEPGAFQSLLNLTIFIYPSQQLFHRRNSLKTGSIILALLTTQSSSGYICFVIVLAWKIILELKVGLKMTVLLSMLIAAGSISFVTLPFLGEKVQGQLEVVGQNDSFSSNRFQSMKFDWYYIQKHPFIGNGFNEQTRFADHPELFGKNLGHGNGLSDFVASMGTLSFLAYVLALLHAKRAGSITWRLALLSIIIVQLMGERFLLTPLFLGLPFLEMPCRRTRVQTLSAS